MCAIQGVLSALGRVLFCAIFFNSAIMGHLKNADKIEQMMANKQVPMPHYTNMLVVALMIVGSISIILGFKARFGALCLILFLVPVTVVVHNFWAPGLDASAMQSQMTNFMKNVSMLGAAVFILANGAGKGSIDWCLCHGKCLDKNKTSPTA